MPSDARWTPRFPHSSVQPSPSAAASQPQLRRRPRAAGRMRTRYSVVSHEALAVSHGSPAPLAPPIFGPAAVHDVSSPILLPLSQPYHPRASTRRAVAGARPGLICEAVLWAKLEPYVTRTDQSRHAYMRRSINQCRTRLAFEVRYTAWSRRRRRARTEVARTRCGSRAPWAWLSQ